MPQKSDTYDIEITLQTLKYATRQLVAELDLDRVIFHALCTIADFGSSQNLSLLLLSEDSITAKVNGIMEESNFQTPGDIITLKGTPLQEVYNAKVSGDYYCQRKTTYPIPTHNIIHKSCKCTCLPLVGTSNKVIGFINFEHRKDHTVHKNHNELFSVITTLIATAIENARLFQMATIDGLTGLYVRRYFDIRLQEEITRLKRSESRLGLIVFDIDHFKNFNDTYGHQQGDVILADTAEIIRNAVRKDVDIPCRYGGEEFVVILPGTDQEGAIVLAERIRKRCEDNQYRSLGEKPMRVTISGGIATIDSKTVIDKEEFFKRADMKLYEAKQAGRNRIRF